MEGKHTIARTKNKWPQGSPRSSLPETRQGDPRVPSSPGGVQALLSQQGARSRHPRFPDSQQVQLLSWQFCSLLPPLMIPLGSCHPPPLPLVPSERLQGADSGWSFLSLGASVQWYGRGWTEPLQSHWVEGFHADSQHESLQIHGSWMEKQKYRNWDRTGWSIWRPNLLVILRTPQSVAVGSASTQQC